MGEIYANYHNEMDKILYLKFTSQEAFGNLNKKYWFTIII